MPLTELERRFIEWALGLDTSQETLDILHDAGLIELQYTASETGKKLGNKLINEMREALDTIDALKLIKAALSRELEIEREIAKTYRDKWQIAQSTIYGMMSILEEHKKLIASL